MTDAGVSVVDLQFSDIAGGIKALTIPRNLAGTSGTATASMAQQWPAARQVELDLYLAPDPTTLAILPPREEAAPRPALLPGGAARWPTVRRGSALHP